MYKISEVSKRLNISRQAVYQLSNKYKLKEKGYEVVRNGKKYITKDGLEYIQKQRKKDKRDEEIKELKQEIKQNNKYINQLKNKIEVEKELKEYLKSKLEAAENTNKLLENKIEILESELNELQDFINNNFFVKLIYNIKYKKIYKHI